MNRFFQLGLILIAPAAHAGQISAEQGWSRATAAAHGTAAGYLTIRNAGPPDRLQSAGCAGAAHTMLHRSTTTMANMPGMGAMPMDHMEAMPGADIPAHGTLSLVPGGLHLMLDSMATRLDPGQSVQCTLNFVHAGAVPVTLAVRPAGASTP